MKFSSRTMTAADWPTIIHFRPSEFKHPEKMGWEFMSWLDKVAARAVVAVRITSSYRDPDYNKQVGGAEDSAHCDVPCNAVDIGKLELPSDPHWNYGRFKIEKAALDLGCVRIGKYADGSMHLDRTEDVRPAPRMWIVVDRPA